MTRRSTGAIMEKAHSLLVSGFTRADLQRVLRFKLDVKLYEIATPGGNDSDMVFEVINWFEQRGRLRELIEQMASARPRESEWTELRNQLLFNPVIPEAVNPEFRSMEGPASMKAAEMNFFLKVTIEVVPAP
jgi:hypothetical protein